MFLDSDDFLELTCVEESLNLFEKAKSEYNKKVDLVWFGCKPYYEGKIDRDIPSIYEIYGFSEDCLITNYDLLNKSKGKNIYFSVSFGVLIDFDFFTKINLEFLKGTHKCWDSTFGIKLFMQANNIFVTTKNLYNYVIHSLSITTLDIYDCVENTNDIVVPVNKYLPYQEQIHKVLLTNEANWYDTIFNIFILTLELNEFLDNYPNKDLAQLVKQTFFKYLVVNYCLEITVFTKDPMNLIPRLQKLKPCIEELDLKLNRNQRIALYYPKFYNTFRNICNLYQAQKIFERKIRNFIRNKKKMHRII